MVMGEEPLMLKCELVHLLYGISKPKNKKNQFHDSNAQ
jgi:hypothetical protein